jgi:DNA-binding MarR family transcriptional regulator
MSSTERKALLENFELLGRQMSTATILFHNALSEALGLTPVELKAIEILDRMGPQTAGEMSLRTNLTTGAITNLVDRLEAKKLAERRTDPNDRRKVIIHLKTNKTMARIGSMYDSLGIAWHDLCDSYTTDELELISDFMQRTIGIMHEEIGKVNRS